MYLKKRRYARVDLELPAELAIEPGGEPRVVEITNLGPDGAYVRTPARLEPGARVRIMFRLTSHPIRFELGAEVRWQRDGTDAGVGCHFVDVIPYDRAAIDDFCQYRLDESRGRLPNAGPV